MSPCVVVADCTRCVSHPPQPVPRLHDHRSSGGSVFGQLDRWKLRWSLVTPGKLQQHRGTGAGVPPPEARRAWPQPTRGRQRGPSVTVWRFGGPRSRAAHAPADWLPDRPGAGVVERVAGSEASAARLSRCFEDIQRACVEIDSAAGVGGVWGGVPYVPRVPPLALTCADSGDVVRTPWHA